MSAELTAQEPSAKYLVNLQPPLVRHFDLIAQAPGGVARLRELILTLAVQGKLVPQDPNDEPASELLEKIRVEKDRLIADKKLKREKDEPALTGNALPFDLPKTWAWVALGEVVDRGCAKFCVTGQSPWSVSPIVRKHNDHQETRSTRRTVVWPAGQLQET